MTKLRDSDIHSNTGTAKPWLTRLLLLAAGVGVSVALAEGIVRVLFPYSRDTAIPGRFFVIDDLLGWKLRSGVTSMHRTRYFAVEYVTNALGFRDRPRPNPRSSSAHRILLYGDSQMFGWGVPQAERFSDILEERIVGLEVWNHAVTGYGLDQEVLSYERDMESTEFEEAMFFVSGGTLGRIHSGYLYSKYKPVFSYDPSDGLRLEPVPRWKNRTVSFLYDTFSPLYLPYFVQNRLTMLKTPAAGTSVGQGVSGESKYIGILAMEILQRARTTTRRNNQNMSVLVGDVSTSDREDLRQFCEQENINFFEIPLEVAATQVNNDRMDLVLGFYDRHWNSKANRLIADQLEKQIRR